MNTRKITVFLAATLSIALVGCGGGEATVNEGPLSGTAPPANTPAPVTPPPATTGTASLSWLPPAQNSDGSTLTNLAGYRIYYGASENSLDKVIQVSSPGVTSYVVTNLAGGTHYFSISAYSTTGIESGRSAVASKTI